MSRMLIIYVLFLSASNPTKLFASNHKDCLKVFNSPDDGLPKTAGDGNVDPNIVELDLSRIRKWLGGPNRYEHLDITYLRKITNENKFIPLHSSFVDEFEVLTKALRINPLSTTKIKEAASRTTLKITHHQDSISLNGFDITWYLMLSKFHKTLNTSGKRPIKINQLVHNDSFSSGDYLAWDLIIIQFILGDLTDLNPENSQEYESIIEKAFRDYPTLLKKSTKEKVKSRLIKTFEEIHKHHINKMIAEYFSDIFSDYITKNETHLVKLLNIIGKPLDYHFYTQKNYDQRMASLQEAGKVKFNPDSKIFLTSFGSKSVKFTFLFKNARSEFEIPLNISKTNDPQIYHLLKSNDSLVRKETAEFISTTEEGLLLAKFYNEVQSILLENASKANPNNQIIKEPNPIIAPQSQLGKITSKEIDSWSEQEIIQALLELFSGGSSEELVKKSKIIVAMNSEIEFEGKLVSVKDLLETLHKKTNPQGKLFETWTKIVKKKFGVETLGDSELVKYLVGKNLSELLDIFKDSPELFLAALERLGAKPPLSYDQIIEQFVGFPTIEPRQGTNLENLSQTRTRYLNQAMSQQRVLDANELIAETEYLKRLTRKEWEKNPQVTLNVLKSEIEVIKNHSVLTEESRNWYISLYQNLINHFESLLHFAVYGMKSTPLHTQVEGIKFLVDNPRAILADEVGMGKTYQAVAAIETMRAMGKVTKPVFWITTKTNMEVLRNDILEHSTVLENEIVVLPTSAKERQKVIENLAKDSKGIKYIITQYRSQAEDYKRHVNDQEWTHPLKKSLIDILVLDEGHNTGNEETLRSQASLDMEEQRTIVLTATPYQGNPIQILTLLRHLDPDHFNLSEREFIARYPLNTEGAKRLRKDTAHLILRRNIHESIPYFESETIAGSFAEQLASGSRMPRPKKEDDIVVKISAEQTREIYELLSNYRAWGAKHKITVTNSSRMEQLNHYRAILFEPNKLGLSDNHQALRGQLKPSVDAKIKAGQKVALWAFNTETIDALAEMFAEHNPVVLNGNSGTQEQRAALIQSMESDPSRKIFIGNFEMAEGFSLHSVEEAIFVQLPWVYPKYYQSVGRHARLVSQNRPDRAKEFAQYRNVIFEFDAEILDSLPDGSTKTAMTTRGTYIEQLRNRLKAGEAYYKEMFMGYSNEEETGNYLLRHLIHNLEVEK